MPETAKFYEYEFVTVPQFLPCKTNDFRVIAWYRSKDALFFIIVFLFVSLLILLHTMDLTPLPVADQGNFMDVPQNEIKDNKKLKLWYFPARGVCDKIRY